MKIRKILLMLAVSLPFAGSAETLELTTTMSGMLENRIPDPASVTSLTVIGPIDAGDMYFIGRNMTSLRALDLEGATISEVKGAMIEGRTSYPSATIPAGAFAGLPLTSVILPRNERITIGDAAFASTALTQVSLPQNVDSVGHGVFAGCAQLQTAVFPAAAKVGTSLFAECTALVSVDMNGVTVIPAGSFRDCTALTTVKGAENVTSIGDRAFLGDTSLKEFAFGGRLATIGDDAFARSGLAEADLTASTRLKQLGDRAFAENDLQSVSLPRNLNVIGEAALYGNSSVDITELPAGLITLGASSLVGTHLGQEVFLPASLEEIGEYALMGQDGVSVLSLPAALVRIGSYAMEDMTGLKNIGASMLMSVPELGDDVWKGVAQHNVTLTVNDVTADDFRSADQWKEFKLDIVTATDDIIVDETASSVYGRFVGTDLQILSKGSPIAEVRLFDASGRQLAFARPAANQAVLDTADFPTRVFIVSAILDDNTSATLKLAR